MRIRDWSADVCSSDLDALAAVAFEGMGGEGDDGDVARSVLAQYLGRRFPSVHFAERDVHEDDVGLGALRELNPFGAADRADGVIALPLETPLEHVPIHFIVFEDEDLCHDGNYDRSEEQTSELQTIMRNPFAIY